MQNDSTRQPIITNHGLIAVITAGKSSKNSAKIWEGTIGSWSRVQENYGLAEKITSALDPENLTKYFVPTDESAPDTCIDGRRIEGYDLNEALRMRGLGSHVPGGTAAASIAYRVAVKNGYAQDETVLDDLDYIIRQYKKYDIYFGGHIDDHATGKNTGCGAIDKMPAILRKFSQFEAIEELFGLVKALLGNAFSEDTFHLLSGRLIRLQGNKRAYLQKDDNGEYAYRSRLIDDIRNSADGSSAAIEKLIGEHKEVGLIINLVPNTTFDRDRFSFDNKDEIQLFNYDFWRTQQIAELLNPVNYTMSEIAQHLVIRQRNEFVTFSAMYGVATAMILTDGSIDLIVRS